MRNISLNINLKTLVLKLKTHFSVVFYIVMVVVIVMEFFVAYNSVKHILLVKFPPQDLPPQRGVRLNFSEYEQAVARIELGKKYIPPSPIFENPFGNR